MLDHYANMDLNKDACDMMADHLSEVDEQKKVEWKCKDIWAGNADDVSLKKFRKNQHQ